MCHAHFNMVLRVFANIVSQQIKLSIVSARHFQIRVCETTPTKSKIRFNDSLDSIHLNRLRWELVSLAADEMPLTRRWSWPHLTRSLERYMSPLENMLIQSLAECSTREIITPSETT